MPVDRKFLKYFFLFVLIEDTKNTKLTNPKPALMLPPAITVSTANWIFSCNVPNSVGIVLNSAEIFLSNATVSHPLCSHFDKNFVTSICRQIVLMWLFNVRESIFIRIDCESSLVVVLLVVGTLGIYSHWHSSNSVCKCFCALIKWNELFCSSRYVEQFIE